MHTKLLIARHGNTFRPGDILRRVGKTDLPLVESGLIQGQNVGTYLKKHHLIPDVIFTSELHRTKQTAEQIVSVLAHDIPIISLSCFNEIDYGPDENQPEDEVILRLGKEQLLNWDTQAIVPQGWNVDPQQIIKQWFDFAKRIRQEYKGKTVLVVTSNGIARFAPYLTLDYLGFIATNKIKLATGAVCVFENKAGKEAWQCLGWNITTDKQQ